MPSLEELPVEARALALVEQLAAKHGVAKVVADSDPRYAQFYDRSAAVKI